MSLTIIGWFIGLTALFSLYRSMTIRSNELAMRMVADAGMSIAFQQVVGLIGSIVALVCAFGILKGLPWSRVLYVGWGVIGLIIGMFTSPFKSVLILGAAMLAVFAFFLFRPAADRCFAAKGVQLRRADA